MAIAALNHPADAVAAAVSEIVATIPAWWARQAEAAGLAPRWRDWQCALERPPIPVRHASSLIDLVDAEAAELGEAYVRSLPPTIRLREGRHYTPEALARVLWKELTSAGFAGGPIVDPACGAGALLLEPVRRFVSGARDPAALSDLPRVVFGTDLDPIAVWLGNALLAAEMLPLWAELPEAQRRRLPRLLHVRDGLTPMQDEPQLVIMNPPYGRIRLSAEQRERWRESLFGHANRYALFLHAAIDRVAAGGFVAAVLPTSFLGGAYYQRLRAFIAQHAPLARVTFVDARSGVFVGDVLQETCLAIFRKDAVIDNVTCSRLAVNGSAARVALPSALPPRAASLPWLLPRRRNDGPLLKAASASPQCLGDTGWKASTGPLVWNRHKPQISPSPGDGHLPILWAADIREGTVRRHPARDHQRWIALRPRDETMKLSEPAVLVQRTTAPEQPRRLVAAHLTPHLLREWGGTVVVENHVNILRCSDPNTPVTAELLVRLLGTHTFDRLYRCLTGTVAVSAYELDQLPLPPAQALRKWQALSMDDLMEAVARYYGDEPS